jgi:hypothetical protein
MKLGMREGIWNRCSAVTVCITIVVVRSSDPVIWSIVHEAWERGNRADFDYDRYRHRGNTIPNPWTLANHA